MSLPPFALKTNLIQLGKRLIQNSRSSGQCRSLRFTIAPIHGCRLKNHLVQTIEITNEDICQLKCYLEPNCVSYNFNKKESADGKHKCDLNNATFELDSDLTKNGNYVYRGAEVNIQPDRVFNVPTRPFSLFLFCNDYFWLGFTNSEAAHGPGRSELSNVSVDLLVWISNKTLVMRLHNLCVLRFCSDLKIRHGNKYGLSVVSGLQISFSSFRISQPN